MSSLVVRGLEASFRDSAILRGVDLEVPAGEIHALMGPNGSGKSTLCHVLSGKPGYTAKGSALVGGTEVLSLDIDARARLGLLQAFQYPVEIHGVPLAALLTEAGRDRGWDDGQISSRVAVAAERFAMTPFLERSLNTGLSGGEKKRSEIFQLATLEPAVAVLDEIDSGLDIDAVREVAAAVEEMRSPESAILMITHYSRILRYMSPDRVHVMMQGKIVASGGPELAEKLESGGYEGLRRELGIEAPEPEAVPKPADTLTDTPFDI